MSLVEQALLRVKRASGQQARAAPPKNVAAPPLPPLHESDAGSARRLIVDLDYLRTAGYLPEEAAARRFADHFQKIKRPLIQKAMSDDTGAEARLIVVTSALAGDGKTFTGVNLALSMARERDVSVLLVDADLPKPHITRIFGLQREPGLLDALVDESRSIESLVVPTTVRGLSILPAGTPAEGTSELIASKRMAQIVKALCGHDPRRLVLFDTAPLLITAEGRVLITLCGQVVLVVRAGITPRQAVQEALSLLSEKQAGGIVLNEAKIGIMDRYYEYGAYGTYGNDAAAQPR